VAPPIVQVIIDNTTSKIIEGTWTFDRTGGGTLVAPAGSTLPGSPTAGELFWLTTTNVLYRRNDANLAWDEVSVVPDPISNPFSFSASCLSTDAVGSAVYISGDSIGGIPQVTTADPTDYTKMPAMGVILSKGTTTSCQVGYLGAISISGLTPNARYHVGLGGSVVQAVPSNRPFIVLVLGQAIDSGRLMLNPSKTLLRLNS
jgi:hypothetical protein